MALPKSRLLPSLLCSLPLLISPALAQTINSLDFVSGKAIFDKNWVAAPASTMASDGLGPYYDARSCAACHPGGKQGRFPGSLVLVLPNDPVYGKQLQQHAVTGLAAEGRLQFGTETVVVGSTELSVPTYTASALQFGPLAQAGSLRLPPSLFGAALFEQVPEQVLQALADPEDSNHDGISGRLTGRYGWKAESNSLAQQAGKALSVDIGLGNRYFPSSYGDCTPAQTQCLRQPAGAEAGALEAPDTVLNLLLSYLQGLRAPVPVKPADPSAATLFATLGCAACHVPELPTSKQPLQAWTDLLLHDLGKGLAAPHGATPTPEQPVPASASEWRTAPLWGLSQRQHLLHDGRADSVLAAILWHGGEAETSVKAFSLAPKLQQEHLLAFLQSL